jgi:predicted flavoprotein YhiN
MLIDGLVGGDWADAEALASFIKAVPVRLLRSRPIAEAISTAGGVAIEACEGLMLRAAPGVFVCGEMLDWDAPTGGFLLQACFSTGHAAGTQAHAWITRGATPCATPRTS